MQHASSVDTPSKWEPCQADMRRACPHQACLTGSEPAHVYTQTSSRYYCSYSYCCRVPFLRGTRQEGLLRNLIEGAGALKAKHTMTTAASGRCAAQLRCKIEFVGVACRGEALHVARLLLARIQAPSGFPKAGVPTTTTHARTERETHTHTPYTHCHTHTHTHCKTHTHTHDSRTQAHTYAYTHAKE